MTKILPMELHLTNYVLILRILSTLATFMVRLLAVVVLTAAIGLLRPAIVTAPTVWSSAVVVLTLVPLAALSITVGWLGVWLRVRSLFCEEPHGTLDFCDSVMV